MEIYERLQALQSEDMAIQVGQVGCGQMGSGLVHVTNQMPGMDSTAIADIDIKRPVKVLEEIGISKSDMCITNKVDEAEDALRSRKRVVTEDALLLTRLESLDAVV